MLSPVAVLHEPLEVLAGLLGGLVLASGVSKALGGVGGLPHGLLAMFLVLMAKLGWTSMFFPLYDPGVSLKHVLPFLLAKLHVMVG